MKLGALAPYEDALVRASPLALVTTEGRLLHLNIAKFLNDPDDADQTVLDRCIAPVLDVGCGPGRFVQALSAQGRPALGVDIADVAVALTCQRGAAALQRDVFDALPGEGRWPTVLVLDGNIGIGGDVASLLNRLRRLLGPRSALFIEASTQVCGTDEVLDVRFLEQGVACGPTFRWARISADVLAVRAEQAGFAVTDQWSAGERDFLRLSRSTTLA